jgi:hypothetical protein
LEKLRYGFSYGVSVTPFFNTRFGLGAKFVGTRYSSSGYGLTDKVNTFYVAPEFVVRLPVGLHKNAWVFAASMGYVHYSDKATVKNGAQARFTKGGVKSTIEAGFDFRISKGAFFGLKMVIAAGYIPVEIKGYEYNESLNAIELGGGFRF